MRSSHKFKFNARVADLPYNSKVRPTCQCVQMTAGGGTQDLSITVPHVCHRHATYYTVITQRSV